jgi:hypothetical protein
MSTGSERPERWLAALKDLLVAYRDVERHALNLPSFGELARASRSQRREFRRQYRQDVKSLGWRAQLFLVARGDFMFGAALPRSFVRYFVDEHLGGRLRLLRQLVLVEDSLTRDQQDALLAEIDRVLPLWPQRPFIRFFYAYALPLSAVVAAFVRFWTAGNTDPENAYAAPLFLLVYAGIFAALPAVAFSAKRALMIGGGDSLLFRPAGLRDGQGTYAVEKRVFGVLAPSRRERPLDLMLFPAAIVLFASGFLPMLELPYVGSGYAVPAWLSIILVSIGLLLAAISIAISIAAFRERRRLGRD